MSGKLLTHIDRYTPIAKTVREVDLERLLGSSLPHLKRQFAQTGNRALATLIEDIRKRLGA